MELPAHSDLARLVSLLHDIGSNACEAIGLLPARTLEHSGYTATPKDSLTFAGTGGDGAHFSFLTLKDIEPSLSPVVMTVPMSFDRPNLIIGADLREFLGLGLSRGYFGLEQLVYDRDQTIALLDQTVAPNHLSAAGYNALTAIQRTFGIGRWKTHGPRLAELEAAFPLG